MDDRIARTWVHFKASLLLGLLLTGCGGGGDSPAPTWTIGGTITGLTGAGLVLRNNGGNDLAVAASGSFTFAGGVPNGTPYAVTVQAQPTNPAQTCSVTSGSGTASANVSSVATCVTDTYTVGGLVSGLLGSGLVLRNNGGNDLAITADGAFTFSAAVVSGTPFAVSVRTPPSNPSQTCTVNGGSGSRASAVTNVSIECVVNSFTVGGGISNLRGTGLALQINGGEIVSPSGSNFVFPTAIPSGRAYSVVVTGQPTNPHQTCSPSAAGGTMTNANVTSIGVACVTNTYTVSGTVTGVLGSGLVLRNNAGNPVVVTGDGPFTFPDRSASGDGYFVSAFSHPTNPAQESAIVDGRGTVVSSPITGVRVICYLVGRWMFVTRRVGRHAVRGRDRPDERGADERPRQSLHRQLTRWQQRDAGQPVPLRPEHRQPHDHGLRDQSRDRRADARAEQPVRGRPADRPADDRPQRTVPLRDRPGEPAGVRLSHRRQHRRTHADRRQPVRARLAQPRAARRLHRAIRLRVVEDRRPRRCAGAAQLLDRCHHRSADRARGQPAVRRHRAARPETAWPSRPTTSPCTSRPAPATCCAPTGSTPASARRPR